MYKLFSLISEMFSDIDPRRIFKKKEKPSEYNTIMMVTKYAWIYEIKKNGGMALEKKVLDEKTGLNLLSTKRISFAAIGLNTLFG